MDDIVSWVKGRVLSDRRVKNTVQEARLRMLDEVCWQAIAEAGTLANLEYDVATQRDGLLRALREIESATIIKTSRARLIDRARAALRAYGEPHKLWRGESLNNSMVANRRGEHGSA